MDLLRNRLEPAWMLAISPIHHRGDRKASALVSRCRHWISACSSLSFRHQGLHVSPLAKTKLHFLGATTVLQEIMPSIIPIGDKWRAQVRRKGFPAQTKTFSTKALARQWAKTIEGDTEKLTAG